MTTLIFVRHGQSTANQANTFTGQSQAPLTENGRTQARLAARALADTRLGAAYCSDLLRAKETGQIIAETQGLAVTEDVALREIQAGLWENRTFADIIKEFPEEYRLWHEDIGNSRCPEGESVAALQKRVLAAVERIARQNDGKTVLIATHATPIRALLCFWHGFGLERMHEIPWPGNASLTTVTYENGTFQLLTENDCSPLGDLHTELDKRI